MEDTCCLAVVLFLHSHWLRDLWLPLLNIVLPYIFVFYGFQKLGFGELFLFVSKVQIVSSVDTGIEDDLGG